MWLLCGLMLLFFAAWAGVRVWLEFKVQEFRKHRTPAELAQVREMLDKPVEIPLAWREIKPWDPALMELADRWIEEFETFYGTYGTFTINHPTSHLDPSEVMQDYYAKGAFSEQIQWEVDLLIDQAKPIMDVALAAAKLPSYDMNAIRPHHRTGQLTVPHTFGIQWVVQVLRIRALRLAERGEKEAALVDALEILPLAVRPDEVVTDMAHLVGIGIEIGTLKALLAIVDKCDNVQNLENALLEMAKFRPKLHAENFPPKEGVALMTTVGSLREYRRAGHQVDLESKAPLVYFRKQWYLLITSEVDRNYYKKSWRVPRFFYFIYHQWIDILGFQRPFLEIILMEDNPIYVNCTLLTSEALFDLTRLKIALRLRELSGAGNDDQPLSPEQLAHWSLSDLEDPFTDPLAPYLWSPERKAYYSVGPDNLDDKATIGGIWLEQPHYKGDVFWE
jgi:hypothetical protein